MNDAKNQDGIVTFWDSSNPEELHRVLFEEAADGMFITDPHGRYIAVNPRGTELTGYSGEEILGMTITDLIPPEDLARDPIRMDELRQGGIVTNERRLRRKDGSLLVVEVSARMLPAGNLLGIVRDITERKGAEAVSEQRARELAALQALGFAVSASLSLEQTSAAALRGMLEAVQPDLAFLFLREGEQLILQEMLPPVARQRLGAIPDHRVGECICGLAVREGRSITSRDIRIDRHCTWEDCKQAGIRSFAELPLRSGEEIIGVIGLASLTERDFEAQAGFLETLAHQVSMALANARLYEAARRELTERKRAEAAQARLNAILENTSHLVSTATPDAKLSYLNQAGREMAGWGKEESLDGRVIADLHPAWALEKIESEGLPAAAATGLWEGETAILHRDNREVPVSQVILAHHASDGALQYFSTIMRDITERKKSEEVLRSRENLLSSIFRAAPTGIGVVSNRVLLAVNDRICEMIGWAQEELIGKSARILYPSDADFEYVGTEKYRQIGKRGTGTVETRWQCKDGRIIDVLLSSTPINPLDMASGVTFTALDISERRKTELALRASEEQVCLALKAANQGFYDLNVQTGEAQVSPEYATMLGYDPAEFHETNAAWIERLHPEDHEPVTAIYRDYIAGKSPEYRAEFRQRTKSGDWKWVLSLGKIVERDARGEPLRMLGTRTDITERKLAEEAIARERLFSDDIINSLPGVFYMYNDQAKLVRWNRKHEEVTGYSPEELFGMDVLDFFSEAYKNHISLRVQSVFAEGEAFAEAPLLTKGGEQIPHFFTGRLTVLDGKQYFLGVGVDIAERKRAEEEKDQLQAQLLHAQKMEAVALLAGGVAHDFNNMLSAILGHTELAMMQCTPSEPIHAHLKVIEKSGLRSADLVRQLLAFARRQTVEPKVLDLNDSVTGMLNMLLRLIGEDIDLVWIPGAGLWPVRIDPSQIDQLLANLCVNARDAIAGVGKVTIETENTAFDVAYCAVHPGFACGEYVMLAVSDDGCGMSKEVLDRLFEPFFTTKEVGKGTGLGLATVYGIVKQNDGFINVYNKPGKGSTFKIYLPRFAGEVMQPTAARTVETPKGRGETVLLVEDEAVILNVGSAMLERLGYTVLTAGTPGEALRQAKAHAAEIQLLITDVVMPEMNGGDLAKLISGIKPGLKCLFTSGYTANVIAHRGVLDEGVYFLQKPFSMKDLASKVREALEQE